MQTFVTNVCVGGSYAYCVVPSFLFREVSVYLGATGCIVLVMIFSCKKEISTRVKDDPRGLAMLRSGNCFNCHNFDSKGIGPSFYDISKRYSFTAANVSQVAKRILEGSTGVWGKVSMPTHPELKKEEAEDIVRWVLQNAAKPDVNYYVGADGFFRIKAREGSKGKGVVVVRTR